MTNISKIHTFGNVKFKIQSKKDSLMDWLSNRLGFFIILKVPAALFYLVARVIVLALYLMACILGCLCGGADDWVMQPISGRSVELNLS